MLIHQEFMCRDTSNMKRTVIPVISGATGIGTKCLRKYVEAVPGKRSFTAENSCTWNITHNTEIAAV